MRQFTGKMIEWREKYHKIFVVPLKFQDRSRIFYRRHLFDYHFSRLSYYFDRKNTILWDYNNLKHIYAGNFDPKLDTMLVITLLEFAWLRNPGSTMAYKAQQLSMLGKEI